MSTNIPGLEGTDFKDPAAPKQRLVWSVYGDTKTGKSSFALWGPEPVVVADMDKRLEIVINDFISGKTTGAPKIIKTMDIQLPKVDAASRKLDSAVQKQAELIWDRFLNNYDKALKSSMLSGGVRTIAIDTGTELLDLRLMAEFGRLLGINPRDRGGANAEFTEIMRRGESYNANVVWLHHVKDEWKTVVDDNGKEKSMTTGNVVLDGFNKANRIVQVVAKTNYNDAVKDPRKKFEVQIVRCGVNAMVNGMKFTSADWAVWDESDKDAPPVINYGPFAFINSVIFPETTPEDWM